jgi:hypothetical protein
LEQVLPSDEDLFMMILSAKSVKDYVYTKGNLTADDYIFDIFDTVAEYV